MALAQRKAPNRNEVAGALEVLALLHDGASNRSIAEQLVISEKTVSVHVTNLMAKLGVGNRGAAAALARDLAPAARED